MLITFKTPAHGDLTFFGSVALELIRSMGHSGSVPSALAAEDVPAALVRLRETMASGQGDVSLPSDQNQDEEEQEAPVPLRHRAQPLIELLEAAAVSGVHVVWERS
jgi:hypothetical protein